MDIDHPSRWEEYESDGEVGRFSMVPPRRIYERGDSNARLVVEPSIPSVPAAESPVTVDTLKHDYGHTLPGHYGEYVQTLLYAAMLAEGSTEDEVGVHKDPHRPPEEETLPALFSDAPIHDDRYDHLEWTIVVEYMQQGLRSEEEMHRPASRPTPKVRFRAGDRGEAVETTENLLALQEVAFDLPVTVSW